MCRGRRHIVFASLCQLILITLAIGQTCKQINNCACKMDDGTVIDISSLGNNKGGPAFDYTLPDNQPSSIWKYAFNPCYSFSDSYCKDVIACQQATDLQSSYPLGKEKATWSSDGKQITYEASIGPDDGLARTTRLTLYCDLTAIIPKLSIQGEDIVIGRQYDFALTSICACPDACKPSPTGGGGGLSFGSILCIIFSVLVVVYIIGGMVFMKFVKGAEGKEVIPNVEIWMNFHIYVKDGVLFVKSKVTGSSDSYETVE